MAIKVHPGISQNNTVAVPGILSHPLHQSQEELRILTTPLTIVERAIGNFKCQTCVFYFWVFLPALLHEYACFPQSYFSNFLYTRVGV